MESAIGEERVVHSTAQTAMQILGGWKINGAILLFFVVNYEADATAPPASYAPPAKIANSSLTTI